MTELTEEQWQRVRRHFGDVAYEHPELHAVMLDLLDANDLDGALERATRSKRLSPRPRRSSTELPTSRPIQATN